MEDKNVSGVHWSFWIIGAIALIWNIMGVVNFFSQMNTDIVAAMPDSHRAIIEGRPLWATAGFAVAVFGGSLGCILLLIRKPGAFYLFVVSLLGVIVTMIHTVDVAGAKHEFSSIEIAIMILTPVIVAAFLIWYAKQVERRGWIGGTLKASSE